MNMDMKRHLLRAFACFAAAAMVLGCQSAAKKAAKEAAAAAAAEQARQDSIAAALQAQKEKTADELFAKLPEEPVFDIETNLGTIKVKLYSKTPKHRDNFAKLALKGYYDGLLFHRVINNFMIQGGDPNTRNTTSEGKQTWGQGGPGYTIPAEFVPEYKHKKGALAAARRGDVANPKKESSGSQFYLVQSPESCAQLDGEYTVFGETIQGIDIIDRIASVATEVNDRPKMEVKIKSISLDKSCLPED